MASLYKISLALGAIAMIVAGQQQADAVLLDPLVETGVSKVSPEGRHVGVHVPGFFNLMLDTRGVGHGFRMSQNIMSGLVNIFIDLEKRNDSLKGPVRVKVGGITMYNNGEASLDPPAADESMAGDADGLIEGPKEEANGHQGGAGGLLRQGSQLPSRLGSLLNRQ